MKAAPPTARTPVWREVYLAARRRHGHQNWWPAGSPFEVCVGAILTQNTAWTLVERALARLREQDLLEASALHEVPIGTLTELIRPAGCPTVKARRLRAFTTVLVDEFQGRLDLLFAGSTTSVRQRLLAIHGLGPETADCLLLYAGGHAIFVIDAYTRRILSRHGWCTPDASYPTLQSLLTASEGDVPGGERLDYWQDFHAQLVVIAKTYCRARAPLCDRCPLASFHPHP